MEAQFPIVDATEWRIAAEETAGADPKYWLEDPSDGQRWLWKPVTVKAGHVHGEDWAEKAASELADLVGVSCARVQIGIRRGQQGSLSLNLKPSDYDMHNGAVALSGLLDDYQAGRTNPAGRPGHNLENIRRVLESAEAPPQAKCPASFSGFDCFAGMLVLDAWIANRDRHDENWSVLYPRVDSDPPQPVRLCGAYDQAGCLGFNLLDSAREDMINTGRIESWCRKGTAWRFEHDGRPASLVTIAATALSYASEGARRYWLEALEQASAAEVEPILSRLPVLSDLGRTFASEVLRINRERLLNECN